MPIGYEDVLVSQIRLDELKRIMDESDGQRKYYRYKAWLHYANLDRWQKQGHHFFYLTSGTSSGNRYLCTCGLYLTGEGEIPTLSPEILTKFADLKLDELQLTKGHRSFDESKSPSPAIIVKYMWPGSAKSYRWTAICQECGERLTLKVAESAKEFVTEHNRNCVPTTEKT